MVIELQEAQKRIDSKFKAGRELICTVGTWDGVEGIIESIEDNEIVVRLGQALRITTCKKHFKYNFKFI